MVKCTKFYGILLFFSFSISCIHAQNGSFGRLSDELSISNITVRTMLQDSKGFLWLGTWHGLYRYDGYNLRKFKVTANLPNENKGSKIVALCEDRNGIIWVATPNTGLYQFDRKTEQFKAFQHDDKDEKSIISNNTNTVFEDKDGRIWVGTRYGIDLFENNQFRHFKNTPSVNWRFKTSFRPATGRCGARLLTVFSNVLTRSTARLRPLCSICSNRIRPLRA